MHLLTGYAKPVKALAVSPDGARLFSAAEGQSLVWEWDLATHELKGKLPGARGNAVTSMAISPDGKWLVAAEAEQGVVAWPLDGGAPVRFRHGGDDGTARTPGLSIHPDGRLV